MPANRLINLAEKWTVEMVDILRVWQAVETLAGRLLDRGTVSAGNGELDAVCRDIRSLGRRLPTWRRRLGLPPRARRGGGVRGSG